MTHFSTRLPALLVGALSALALAACRRGEAAGDGPYADKVAADVPKIEAALGVKFKTPPKLELRSRDEVRKFLVDKLQEPGMQKQLANQEALYKMLGLVRDTMHLADFYVKVLTEQIMGFYDPKTKVLYVVNGAPEEYVGITIMHELIHALQDQYANLDSLEHIEGDDDRQLAAQAVVEGQATYDQAYIMAGGGGNIAAQLPGGWESIRQMIREAADDAADLRLGADGDSGDASLSVHQRLRLHPAVQRARKRKASAVRPAGVDRAAHARLGVLRSAARHAERRHASARFRAPSTRMTSASSARGFSSSLTRRIRTRRSARRTDGTATATRW